MLKQLTVRMIPIWGASANLLDGARLAERDTVHDSSPTREDESAAAEIVHWLWHTL